MLPSFHFPTTTVDSGDSVRETVSQPVPIIVNKGSTPWMP